MKRPLLLVLLLLTASLAGCVHKIDVTGQCGPTFGKWKRPIVQMGGTSYVSNPEQPAGLVFGSIGFMRDFGDTAISTMLWITRHRSPGDRFPGGLLTIEFFDSVMIKDVDLFTPLPAKYPPGAAVFCGMLLPGDYSIASVRVRHMGLGRPSQVHGLDSNQAVVVNHRFTVVAGASVYLGQHVVGSAGVEPSAIGKVFFTNELERDLAKARELGIQVDPARLSTSIPSKATSPLIFDALPARAQ